MEVKEEIRDQTEEYRGADASRRDHLRLRPQHSSMNVETVVQTVVQTAPAAASLDREALPRRALRVAPRGASSHFVGSSIMILSSFAVSTLAMNCGKKIQESKRANLM